MFSDSPRGQEVLFQNDWSEIADAVVIGVGGNVLRLTFPNSGDPALEFETKLTALSPEPQPTDPHTAQGYFVDLMHPIEAGMYFPDGFTLRDLRQTNSNPPEVTGTIYPNKPI